MCAQVCTHESKQHMVKGRYLVLGVDDAGELYEALAPDAALHCRQDLVAVVERRLHVAKRIQRDLELVERLGRTVCRSAQPVTSQTPSPGWLG